MTQISVKERLVRSTLLSIALHAIIIAALFSKPLHLDPRLLTQIGKAPSMLLEEDPIVILKKNQALEETFAHFEIASPTATQSPIANPSTWAYGVEEKQELNLQIATPELSLDFAFPQDPSHQSALQLSLPVAFDDPGAAVQSPAISLDQSSLLGPELSLHDLPGYTVSLLPPMSSQEIPTVFSYLPSEEKPATLPRPSLEMPVSEAPHRMEPLLSPPALCDALAEYPLAASIDFMISSETPQTIASLHSPLVLSEYGFPSLQLKEWNEFFDVDVKTIPREGGGFLFSISLIQKHDLSEHCLKQNYLFIIDRSNSIEKHRYEAFKRAVSRAISVLREGDSFNILLLDASITRLSSEPLPFSKANQKYAEEFLGQQPHGHYGAATDIYTILTQVLTPTVGDKGIVTAILISDGDTPLKPHQQRRKINQWLEANRDRITLYTATAGHGNNLSSLKMLGLASRGSLLYSDTHAAFPRRLAKLIMDLRHPIAKEMCASIISSDPLVQIELLPPSFRLPYLFSDRPFTLLGSASKLTDFVLIVEGKNRDQTLSIRKPISLSKARPGSRLLVKQWAVEKAHALFDQYLNEGEKALLQQAEEQLGHDTQNSRR